MVENFKDTEAYNGRTWPLTLTTCPLGILCTETMHVCLLALSRAGDQTPGKGKWGLRQQLENSALPQASAPVRSSTRSPTFSHFIYSCLPNSSFTNLKQRYITAVFGGSGLCWGAGTLGALVCPHELHTLECVFEFSEVFCDWQDTWVEWLMFQFTFLFFYFI